MILCYDNMLKKKLLTSKCLHFNDFFKFFWWKIIHSFKSFFSNRNKFWKLVIIFTIINLISSFCSINLISKITFLILFILLHDCDCNNLIISAIMIMWVTIIIVTLVIMITIIQDIMRCLHNLSNISGWNFLVIPLLELFQWDIMIMITNYRQVCVIWS